MRSVAATWYSPPKKIMSSFGSIAELRKSVKSAATAPSGTTFCTVTRPPALVNASANASARPLLTALVSLTTATVFTPSLRALLARNGAWRASDATMRK